MTDLVRPSLATPSPSLSPTADTPAHVQPPPLVIPFEEGSVALVDLMGGKGANLAEMTRLGLPVPPGFTVTTPVCREFLHTGTVPAGLHDLVTAALHRVETRAGRRFGDARDPLLVSVRSGARFSMPGMMDTVLDVGLTDETVQGLARRGGERFAWDCYRRLVHMYGTTVLGVDAAAFETIMARTRAAAGAVADADLDAGALRALVDQYRRVLVEQTGEDLPQQPREQLDRAILSVLTSWTSPRAQVYRAHESIPDDLGTAVNIVAMVYGNTGPRSGSGVCLTRNPSTGEAEPYGDYLPNAQGEDVVNGSRATLPLAHLAYLDRTAHTALLGHLQTLEHHYRDMCDVEFTIEDARLWILQTRVGKRGPAAAFVMAAAMAHEGLISLDQALLRVTGDQLEQLLHPQFDRPGALDVVASGLGASPGASVGEVVLDPAGAVALRAAGHSPVLFRTETSAQDLHGMIAASAIVTARGGLASHAAVVARGLGRTCVVSVTGMEVDETAGVVRLPGGRTLAAGSTVSVDGTTGRLFVGDLPVTASVVAAALERGLTSAGEPDGEEPEVVDAVRRLLAHADARRTLGVRANADTRVDALRARRLGAEGIGLCRTEHMLLGERRELVERVIVGDRRREALEEIQTLAQTDFTGILEAMDGLPVVVRLLDPPLHEFLPDPTATALELAELRRDGQQDRALEARAAAVARWHEDNPMLGLRGVRLLTILPELLDVHVRALMAATAARTAAGGDPRPEIMVPLVADPHEMRLARRRIETMTGRREDGSRVAIGSMIELPRAAILAGHLAETADFFSFGTNDLSQTTWGMSRDDAASFLGRYLDQGILDHDPFATLDEEGVGVLVAMAVAAGRAVRPDLGLGACGEHAGDPASIRFFAGVAGVGLDYVSCSPPRVPVARLEAGRAALLLSVGTPVPDTR